MESCGKVFGKLFRLPPASPKHPCSYLVIYELYRLLRCQLCTHPSAHTLLTMTSTWLCLNFVTVSVHAEKVFQTSQLKRDFFLLKYTATSSLSPSVSLSLEGSGVIMSLMDNWQHTCTTSLSHSFSFCCRLNHGGTIPNVNIVCSIILLFFLPTVIACLCLYSIKLRASACIFYRTAERWSAKMSIAVTHCWNV